MKITKINSEDYTIFADYNDAEKYRDASDYIELGSELNEGDIVIKGEEVYIHDAETNNITTLIIGETTGVLEYE